VSVAPGSRLGPYEVVAPLGAGGMGEVWRASDSRLGREVAIKVLPAHLAEDRDALARFEREARTVAALSDPNILALHDFARDDGVLYAVTELLEGTTLRERLRQGPLPWRRVADWGAQAARGLAAAHEKGIVHRDVKPENLFLVRDGRVKVLDFGLARSEEGALPSHDDAPTVASTHPGRVMGTLGYMSPEQLCGEPVDARSDIFALGCVLFEMLTGELPFHRRTVVESMGAVLGEEPAPLAGRADGGGQQISPALARLVYRCLERRPEERFQSARDLAFSLEVLGGPGTTSRAEDRAAAPPRVRPRSLLWPAIALVCLAAGLGAGAWLWRRAPPPPSRLHALTYSGRDAWPAASPDGKLLAFASERDGRSRIWLRQTVSGDEVALTDGADTLPRFSPDGASLLFVRRREGGGSDLWRVATLGGEPRRVVGDAAAGDWSPDGERIAFLRGGSRPAGTGDSAAGGGWSLLTVGTHGSGGEETLLTDPLKLESPRWSPDGSRIALLRSSSIRGPDSIVLADAAGRKRQDLALPGVVWSLAWTADGALLYALAEGAGARLPSSQLVSLDPGSSAGRTLIWVPYTVPSLDALGEGKVVMTTLLRRQNLMEKELAGPQGAPSMEGHWLSRGTSVDRQPVYSPDGEWIAFSSTRGGNLDLWAVSTRSGAIRRLTDDAGEDWDPAYTPDGRHLLWSSNRSGHFEVWIGESDGSAPRQLTRDGVDAENPAVAAGWVVYVSSHPDRQGVWKMRLDGSGAERLVASSDAAHPELSPDGQLVLFHARVGETEELRVVRLATGDEVAPPVAIPLGHPRAQRVLNELNIAVGRGRWRPDGRALLFVGLDDEGHVGIFEQPFSPGAGSAAPRMVVPSDGDAATESFGISPDGARIAVSFREQATNLMLAEGVPGVPATRRVGGR
jgi:Tol biopolymer transport system component